MKIAIGIRPREGSWGGGQNWARSFTSHATDRRHTVTPHLARDCDAAILTHVTRSESAAFTPLEVFLKKRPSMRVVHRINDCDGRNGQTGVMRRQARMNWLSRADVTVFVSNWLMLQYLKAGYACRGPIVIKNAADASIFNGSPVKWDGKEPFRIVTHHWSDNVQKGWDVYPIIAAIPGVELTVIGRAPLQPLGSCRVIGPLVGHELAAELRQHHAYITASQNEPGPMHVCEAMACGLPVLYRASGSLYEYVREGPHWLIPEPHEFLDVARSQYFSEQQPKRSLYTSTQMNERYLYACLGSC